MWFSKSDQQEVMFAFIIIIDMPCFVPHCAGCSSLLAVSRRSMLAR